MRTGLGRYLALAWMAVGFLPTGTRAQAPQPVPNSKIYTHNKHFTLPIALTPGERALLQEVLLFVKNGQNEPWQRKDRVPPTQSGFDYRVSQDGEYWFAIATVDGKGRMTPADSNLLTPGLIVVVDTEQPEISLKALPAAAGIPCVECLVRDANPDPTKVRVEFQGIDKTWLPLDPVKNDPTVYPLPGPITAGSQVRATVTDLAGNVSSRVLALDAAGSTITPVTALSPAAGTVTVEARSEKHPVPSVPDRPNPFPSIEKIPSAVEAPAVPAPTTRAVGATRHFLNGTHAVLGYQIEQQGTSGIGKIEVYVTRDEGQTWQKLSEDPGRRGSVEFDLPGEGVFGVTLVVTNGQGFGGTPPNRGDAPDYTIEVDLTRPTARLESPVFGTGAETGTLLITWEASDKNLGETPIDLYYASHREGPWQPIVRGAGSKAKGCRWALPADVGPEIFVRLDVTDRAGNVTRCVSAQPVMLDVARPKARLVSITTSTSSAALPAGNP